MRGLIPGFILAFACLGTLLSAQEYSLLGEIGLSGSYTEDPPGGAANSIESLLDIEAEHRLEYEKLSFIARHEAKVDRGEEITHTIHEAYLDYRPGEKLRLGAGKQRIAWGRGIAFFPTDALHPSHTDEDVEGFTGVSLIYTPGLNLQLSGALDLTAILRAEEAAPGEGASANEDFYGELKYALYLSYFFGNADLALSAVYRPEKVLRPGIGVSYDLAGFVLFCEGSVEFYNQISYPDAGGYSSAEALEPYPLVSAGLSRNIYPSGNPDLSFSLAAEYLYDGTGYSKQEADNFLSDSVLLEEPPRLSWHYLFATAGVELLQSFSAEFNSLANLQDGSGRYGGRFTLLTIPDIDLSAEGELLTGDGDTEFGFARENEGEYRLGLGARIYF